MKSQMTLACSRSWPATVGLLALACLLSTTAQAQRPSIAAQQAQIATLQSQVAALQTQVANLSVSSSTFRGNIDDLAAPVTDWTFAGPTTNVTVNSTDRILVEATAVLGVGTGAAEGVVDLDVCYQPAGGAVTEVGSNYVEVNVPVTRKAFTVNNVFSGLTGTVTVGLCYTNTDIALIGNDWLQGYALVLR
jgi:hypothetical protein